MLASEGFNEARVMAVARKLCHYILSGFSSFLNRITMTMTTVSETLKQCSTWRGSWRETTLRWQRRLFWWGWVNLSTSKSDLTWHDIIEIHLFPGIERYELTTVHQGSMTSASSVCSSGTSFPAWNYLCMSEYGGAPLESVCLYSKALLFSPQSRASWWKQICNNTNSSLPRSFSSMTHVLPVTVICSLAIHWEGNRMICLEGR